MAVMVQPWLLLLYLLSVTSFSSSQPQNIETFYPFIESPSPAPNTPPLVNPPTEPPLLQPIPVLPPPQPLPTSPRQSSSSSNRRNTIIKAVAATAASTLVFALLFFFGLQKYVIARRRREKVGSINGERPAGGGMSADEVSRSYGSFKGENIVDENGLDVLYWRKLQRGGKENSFNKEISHEHKKEEENEDDDQEMINGGDQRNNFEAVQEVPLLKGNSSSSSSYISLPPERESSYKIIAAPPPPPPPPLPPVQIKKSPSPPTPPPPPIPAKTNPAPPLPPAKGGRAVTSLKPPSGANRGSTASENKGESSNDGQLKMKPLHWDKLYKNVNHSMVWDKIDRGSFSFDGDLMEALFGYVATNRKLSPRGSNNHYKDSENAHTNSSNTGQIIILDPRKSHNSAIVLKSLSLSRKQIIDAVIQGNKDSLNAETLEKLTRIAPTAEEQSLILDFDGDPRILADAESFHYHLLKVIPSAYTRLNALLFRSNYDLEIQNLKEFLQTLEMGCKELRTRGLFMKLLEAILKAGNRMNAGTSRGNAQAFNLTALTKLSDVKSTDGQTTLLHFVVEEVVRSEGKRCVLNRNGSGLSRRSNLATESPTSEENQDENLEKEYIKLGLPVIGGLSSQFSDVQKAADIDYDAFSKTCSVLLDNVAGIEVMLSECDSGKEEGEFVNEMRNFIESAKEDLKLLEEEQTKVMEMVERTTEYYQAGAAKQFRVQPLHLFVIIRDFLVMVDKVCVEIARNLQRRRTPTTDVGSSLSSKSPAVRNVRFPILPANFLNDNKFRSNPGEGSDSGS